jgi:hypothetical protein
LILACCFGAQGEKAGNLENALASVSTVALLVEQIL